MRPGLVALILAATPAAAERLEHIGTFVWDRPEEYFGGWSGIEVVDGGDSFIAIGDNAQLYKGSFRRDAGVIVDVPRRPVGALTDTDGVEFFRKGGDGIGDSEGLALLPDGRFAVSFERVPRILVYGGDRPDWIALPREAGGLAKNGGVEALAVDREGRLLAIPETLPRGAKDFPVWRQTDTGWETVAVLPRTQGFAPVGADVGPDGRLFVLERAFRGVGFQSRIAVVDLATDPPVPKTIWVSATRDFDNLEGISAWRDDTGETRFTLISDDNYNWFQRTEIVEFRLTD